MPLPDLSKINDWPIGLCLHYYLMASYLYYIKDLSLLEDHTYDLIAKRILNEFATFEHPHKSIITKEDLKAGTLFGVVELNYPKMVRSASIALYERLHGKIY